MQNSAISIFTVYLQSGAGMSLRIVGVIVGSAVDTNSPWTTEKNAVDN